VIVEVSMNRDAASLNLLANIKPRSHFRRSVHDDSIPHLRGVLDFFFVSYLA
jgi:hypothetical protein